MHSTFSSHLHFHTPTNPFIISPQGPMDPPGPTGDPGGPGQRGIPGKMVRSLLEMFGKILPRFPRCGKIVQEVARAK